MFWRRKRDYPCDYAPDPKPEGSEATKELLTRTTSVYERPGQWLTVGLADFGYAGELGMRLEDDEAPLASGPALFTFADQNTDGTVLVTDRRIMLVWLDRHTKLNANNYDWYSDIAGFRPSDDSGFGVELAVDNPATGGGRYIVEPKLQARDGAANRRALEWSYTLAAQLRAEFSRRGEGTST